MNKENPQIDTVFKQAFENTQMPPPASAFAAIQSQVLSGAAKSAVIGWSGAKVLGFSIGTLFVGAVGVYTYLNSQGKTVNSQDTSLVADINSVDTTFSNAMSNGDLIFSRGKKEKDAQISNKPFISEEKNTGINATALLGSGKKGSNSRNTIGFESLNSIDKKKTNGAQSVIVDKRIASENGNLAEDFISQYSNAKIVSDKGVVSQASPETEKQHIPMAKRNNPCKNRFEVNLDGNVLGPHEWAFEIAGDIAKYEWGIGPLKCGEFLGQDWKWKGPSYVKKSQELEFWFRAHFIDGCRDTQWVQRWVTPQFQGQVELFPTVFTPNNDGYNDSFYVQMAEPVEYHLIVRDMRGNVVFESKKYGEKWHGKREERRCQPGMYRVWLLRKYWGDTDAEVKSYNLELR